MPESLVQCWNAVCLCYFRDGNGNEVDLLLEEKRKLIPVEIKSAMTYNDRMAAGISCFRQLTPRGYVVYAGDLEFETERYEVLNFTKLAKLFDGA